MADNFYILLLVSITGVAFIVIGFILLQVSSRNKLLLKQKKLAVSEISHQKALLEAVITSQEAERQRIGSDLHDEVGAVLSSLRMLIEKQNFLQGTEKEIVFAARSKNIIDTVIVRLRMIAHNLSPHISGKFGFYDSLQELCTTISESGNLEIVFDSDETERAIGLPADIALVLYRVIAELINNTIRHAKARKITIGIRGSGETMEINYADDGIGLKSVDIRASKGMGFQNIESRLNMIQAVWKIYTESTGFSMQIEVTPDRRLNHA